MCILRCVRLVGWPSYNNSPQYFLQAIGFCLCVLHETFAIFAHRYVATFGALGISFGPLHNRESQYFSIEVQQFGRDSETASLSARPEHSTSTVSSGGDLLRSRQEFNPALTDYNTLASFGRWRVLAVLVYRACDVFEFSCGHRGNLQGFFPSRYVVVLFGMH